MLTKLFPISGYMNTQTNTLERVYSLLFALATGTFSGVIERFEPGDELEQLYLDFQALGLRLRAELIERGLSISGHIQAPIPGLVFILNSGTRILHFNASVLEQLHYSPEDLSHAFFKTLLDDSSHESFAECLQKVQKDAIPVPVPLHFKSVSGALLPLSCCLLQTQSKNFLLVISLEFPVQYRYPSLSNVFHSPNDSRDIIEILEQIRHYIAHHLEEPLPTLSQLAKQFGLEVYQLKRGFKSHFGVSVYQYYQEERLNLSQSLILHTNLSLKEIAYRCGYSMYINFYKAFKKKYGYPPSALVRPVSP